MQAIDHAQPLPTELRGEQPFSVFNIVYLLIGGLLTVVWSGALALCSYDIICWLFG
jgi:hypothetical protein